MKMYNLGDWVCVQGELAQIVAIINSNGNLFYVVGYNDNESGWSRIGKSFKRHYNNSDNITVVCELDSKTYSFSSFYCWSLENFTSPDSLDFHIKKINQELQNL